MHDRMSLTVQGMKLPFGRHMTPIYNKLVVKMSCNITCLVCKVVGEKHTFSFDGIYVPPPMSHD
jgi:hypothetical protein